MPTLTLSVVLSNYNHARFLPAALEGLRRQTRHADEVIIYDDASTDDSVSVISSFLSSLPNARLIQNSRNLGIIKNLNRSLVAASGDLIYFAAADDLTYPGLFENAVRLLETYQEAGLFCAPVDIIDAQGRNLGRFPTPRPLREAEFIDPESARRLLMQDDGWLVGCTTVYRRSFAMNAGAFAEDLGSFCDGYLSRVLWLQHGACFSREVLAGWRSLQGAYSWSQAIDLRQTQRLVAVAERKMVESRLFPEGYPRRWRRRHLFGARRLALAEARRAAPRGIKRIIRLIQEIAGTTWLFLTLRPGDTLTVIRRRLLGGGAN
jgi:glycosyltransferase involved in cell wall biosynthesis